jgi:hypothetical protein
MNTMYSPRKIDEYKSSLRQSWLARSAYHPCFQISSWIGAQAYIPPTQTHSCSANSKGFVRKFKGTTGYIRIVLVLSGLCSNSSRSYFVGLYYGAVECT